MIVLAMISVIVVLVSIGAGVAVALVTCLVAAVLVAIGAVSSSAVIGLLTRRPYIGARVLLFECAIAAGVPAGIFCAYLGDYLWRVAGSSWCIPVYGAAGGAMAGVGIALLLEFIFRRLGHRLLKLTSNAVRCVL